MRKIIALLLSLILLLGLSACGGTGNELFKAASPATSALRFAWFDGTFGSTGWLFDPITEQKILNDLSKVTATQVDDWTPDKLTYPVYGLSIEGFNVPGVEAAWSNGYLILRDGSVYKFDYNFSKLKGNYSWEYTEEISNMSLIPNHRYLTQADDIWFSNYLTPAEEKLPPENIIMELVSASENKATVTLTNLGATEWVYGEYFSLEVLLDDTWYSVPIDPSQNWGFISIGYILNPNSSTEKSYSLAMFGDLPSGTYRLVVEGLTAEFEI